MSVSAEIHAGAVAEHGTAIALGGGIAGHLRSTFESLVLLLLLLAVEALFFGPGYFASLAIHPFWIVVLLASVQNGLFAGIVATALAGLLMDWPPRPIGADITAHYLSIAILPLQWLVVSFCVGLFREGQIRTERWLLSSNARLAEVNEALASEIARLDGMIREFGLAAAIAPHRPGDIGEALKKVVALSTAAPEDIQRRFAEAAIALTAEPARLLMASDQQGHEDRSGGEPYNELEAKLAGEALLPRLNEARRPLLVALGDSGAPARRFAVRALTATVDHRPAAIVAVAVAQDTEPSIAVLIADILAYAAGLALSSEIPVAGEASGA